MINLLLLTIRLEPEGYFFASYCKVSSYGPLTIRVDFAFTKFSLALTTLRTFADAARTQDDQSPAVASRGVRRQRRCSTQPLNDQPFRPRHVTIEHRVNDLGHGVRRQLDLDDSDDLRGVDGGGGRSKVQIRRSNPASRHKRRHVCKV